MPVHEAGLSIQLRMPTSPCKNQHQPTAQHGNFDQDMFVFTFLLKISVTTVTSLVENCLALSTLGVDKGISFLFEYVVCVFENQ